MSQLDILSSLQSAPAESPVHQQVMDLMKEAGAQLKRYSPKLDYAITSGFVVNYGQEWRFTLIATVKNDYKHILFRFYLPARGVPVQLDFYDDDLVTCSTPDDVRKEIELFFQRPSTKQLIDTLIS